MEKYQNVITELDGDVINLATVEVLSYPSNGAVTIYSDDGVITVPSSIVTTNSKGEYFFYAQPGRYNFKIRVNGILVNTITDVQIDAKQLRSDLASTATGLGAELVKFNPAGPAAVARTVQAKLRDQVCALDFIPPAEHAAILAGTSTTNLATYIQAAFDAHPKVWFPRGAYQWGTPIALPNGGIWVIGDGGFQESAASRRTKITYTGTTGWAFDYDSPIGSTQFQGPFKFEGMMIDTPNLTGNITGGAIKIGNDDIGNFSTYENVGRVICHDLFLTGVSGSTDKGVGIFLIRCFDADIEDCYAAGFNYGGWAYGSDITNWGKGNRFQSNGTNLRVTVDGSFSGSAKLDHMDLLASTFCSVWLEGAVAPIMRDNYIENTVGSATTQTGTITQTDLSTTITGSSTVFLTVLAQSLFGGDRKRVLIKVGNQYRQVTAVASDTSLTIDTPFLASFSAQAWSIVKGVGVIASSCDRVYSNGNRIDVTAASAVVPRGYYSGCTGVIDDVALTNTNQGKLVIAGGTPGQRLYVHDTGVQNGMDDAQPGTHYYRAPNGDGSRQRNILQDLLVADVIRPGIVYDHRFWFERDGAGKLSTAVGTGANANGVPIIYVFTSGASGDLSAKLPTRLLSKMLRIRCRARAVTDNSFIQLYKAAALGGTDTLLGSFTLTAASGWEEFDTIAAGPTSAADPYLTVKKNTTNVQWEFVAVQRIEVGDTIPASAGGASGGAYRTLIATTTFGPTTFIHNATPEAAVFGSPGDRCINTAGGAATTLYVKESGSNTNTGWIAK